MPGLFSLYYKKGLYLLAITMVYYQYGAWTQLLDGRQVVDGLYSISESWYCLIL